MKRKKYRRRNERLRLKDKPESCEKCGGFVYAAIMAGGSRTGEMVFRCEWCDREQWEPPTMEPTTRRWNRITDQDHGFENIVRLIEESGAA